MEDYKVSATLYKKEIIGEDGKKYHSFTKILDKDGDIISYPNEKGSICFEPLRPFIGDFIKIVATTEQQGETEILYKLVDIRPMVNENLDTVMSIVIDNKF